MSCLWQRFHIAKNNPIKKLSGIILPDRINPRDNSDIFLFKKNDYWFFLIEKSASTSRALQAITGIVPDFCGVVGTT